MRVQFLTILALLFLPLAGVRADLIKQSSTYTRTVLMTSSSDHITGATGLTLTISASKAGGTPASITPTVTEIGSGRYALALTTTHTNTLGALDLIITATGADPTDSHDQIVAFDPADASLLGLTGVATATTAAAIKTKTDLIATNSMDSPNAISTQGNVTTIQTRLGTPAGASLAADIAALPTTSLIAAGLLNATASSYNTTGSIGAKINAAGSASDPLANPVSGYTGAGTIGKLLGDNLNATISSRQASGTAVTLPTTPPTGYAFPGYYYAPVLDSGTSAGTSLVVTVTNPGNSTTSRLISWTADSAATSYKVLRSVNGTSYTVIATPAAGTLSYTDASRPSGNVYYTVISVH